MRRRSLLTTLLAAPIARQALAEGDNWPVRPVRVVCPFTAGGSQDNALDALRNGDIAAVAAVVSDGVPRFVGRSRNTPGSIKNVRVAACKLPRDFTGGLH